MFSTTLFWAVAGMFRVVLIRPKISVPVLLTATKSVLAFIRQKTHKKQFRPSPLRKLIENHYFLEHF